MREAETHHTERIAVAHSVVVSRRRRSGSYRTGVASLWPDMRTSSQRTTARQKDACTSTREGTGARA
eukprot:5560586-Pleurochrysis_carterae.AAC.2